MIRYLICLILGSLLILGGCTGKNVELEEDLTPNFNKAMNFFNKGKYLRARDEFEYIIMTDPGSKLASESQYYKGESFFQMKEYDESWATFDRYVRFTNDIYKIEQGKCSPYSYYIGPRLIKKAIIKLPF